MLNPKLLSVLLTGCILLLAACGGGSQAEQGGGESAAIGGDPARGEQVFNEVGCSGCHAVETGTSGVGPSLADTVAQAANIIQQDNYQGEATSAGGYVRESIVSPEAHIRGGYSAVMPTNYQDQLDRQQIEDLVAYIMSQE